ncbi:MAG: NnrS family protein, partial [Pseudobdellovibrionaceae bacterium]|nr:NnrS family protein [Pseudobdellovibrionaceae bacterium]
IHAITVGAIGVLIYGIMPRVSLGHTGRPIKPQRTLVAGFALINGAAIVRVAIAGFAANHYADAVIVSGILWTIAFGIFCVLFAPILTAPRLDGRPG